MVLSIGSTILFLVLMIKYLLIRNHTELSSLDHKLLLVCDYHINKLQEYICKNIAVNSYCGCPEEEHSTQKFTLKLEQYKHPFQSEVEKV
jgi:hypothetical protein